MELSRLIGRKEEVAQLQAALASERAELIAIYGRRRIGKTFLIKTCYREQLVFEFTGTQHATLKNQLFKFREKLKEQFGEHVAPQPFSHWSEAFQGLKICLMQSQAEKQVVFLDELPWIATPKSNFLEELAYFWNDWASNQSNLIIVVCGSAAAWMLQKVVSNKGGLHNRLTLRINLSPFTLNEAYQYLQQNGVQWDHYQTIQFYMAVGGVPAYLNEARRGETVTQTIDRLFFSQGGMMRTEFGNLYEALFQRHQNHISVIKALASKWRGLSRQEIIGATHLQDGGGLNQVLEELEAASFISRFPEFGKASTKFLYRLTDEYSLFYLKFIQGVALPQPGEWLRMSEKESYKIWCGYAFESVCLKHVFAIRQALGISGIHTVASSFYRKSDQEHPGLQIDLLLERSDKAIHLCELKFHAQDLLVTETFSEQLRIRREKFRQITKTRHLLFNTLITTWPVSRRSGQIDHIITLEQLFV